MVIPERVGLHAPNRCFSIVCWERVLTENQFVLAISIFDSRAGIISSVKTDARFEQVAVKDRAILNRTCVSPKDRAGPIAIVQRTVVHNRRRGACLIFVGKDGLGTFYARVRILTAPVFSRLQGQAHGPRVDFSLINVPTKFVWLATVKPRGLNSRYAMC